MEVVQIKIDLGENIKIFENDIEHFVNNEIQNIWRTSIKMFFILFENNWREIQLSCL